MRVRTFRSVLDECLTAIQQGDTVDACLARYPRQAERLRPLLLLAERIRQTPPQAPRVWARETAWGLVRERAADLRAGGRRARGGLSYGAWLRPMAVAAALVLALLGSGGATVLAAQDALPDSPLYRVKLWSEDARLWLVFDESHEAQILMDQSDERIAEITALIRKNKDIPPNVLSALYDRHERAARIVESQPQDLALRARLRDQSAAQEGLLVALWDNVADSARDEYAEAVALVHNTRLKNGGAMVSISPQDLAGGIKRIEGEASPVDSGMWNVGGLEVRVDERTIGRAELQQGATARLVVAVGASGQLQALSLSIIATDLPPSRALVSGEIKEITEGGIWLAGGQFIPFSAETLQTGKLKVGERVEVTLETTRGGTVASTVKAAGEEEGEAQSLIFEGTIVSDVTSKSSQWNVGGLTFETAGATVDARAGKAQKGARVQIEATVDNGRLAATSITVLAGQGEADTVHLVGTITGASGDGWMVSGLRLVAPAGTAAPAAGSVVAVEASRQGDIWSVSEATVVEEPGDTGTTRVLGAIRSIQEDRWELETGKVRITSVTVISGSPLPGVRVLIWGRQAQSGGDLEATYVRVLDTSAVAATATPGPTPSPGPIPSPRP